MKRLLTWLLAFTALAGASVVVPCCSMSYITSGIAASTDGNVTLSPGVYTDVCNLGLGGRAKNITLYGSVGTILQCNALGATPIILWSNEGVGDAIVDVLMQYVSAQTMAVQVSPGNTANLTDVRITAYPNPALSVIGAGTLILNRVYVFNCPTNGLPPLNASNGAQIIIKDTTFSANVNNGAVPGGGGAIYATNGVSIVGQGLTCSNNAVTGSRWGGCMLVSLYSTVNLVNSTFLSNTAAGSGGAIAIDQGTTLTCTGCVFTTNSAPTGSSFAGAVFINDRSSAVFVACVWTSNGAGRYGGGVGAQLASNITVSGGSFTTNTAQSEGGGIYMIGGSTALIDGATFTCNRAYTNGGGARITASIGVTISGSTFQQNVAYSDGGGASLTVPRAVVVGSTFNGNSASPPSTYGKGGGLAVYGALNLNTSTFNYNTLQCPNPGNSNLLHCGGGALYVQDDLMLFDATFHSNSVSVQSGSPAFGGAVFLPGPVASTMRKAAFSSNLIQTLAGGGSGAGEGAAVYSRGCLTLAHQTQFSANYALLGGALSVASNLTISDAGFNVNNADYGSAILYDGTSPDCNTVISITRTTLGQNVASTGSIYMGTCVSLQMSDSVVTENSNEAWGAVACSGCASITLTNTSFTNNANVAQGVAAVYFSSETGALVIDSCRFIGNSAVGAADPGNAGAVWVLQAHTVVVQRSTFIGNTAIQSWSVGGLWIQDCYNGTILVANCTFQNNAALGPDPDKGAQAGALGVTGPDEPWNAGLFVAAIVNCTFDNNYSVLSGGAVGMSCVNPGSDLCVFSIQGSIFRNNTALGTHKSGGGVYCDTCTIRDSIFYRNTAISCGGGVGNGAFTAIINTLFLENRAGSGGGVALYCGSISGSTFVGNTAQFGGGALSQASLTICDSTFHDNVANHTGGGLSGVALTIARTNVTYNSACSGGGIAAVGTASLSSVRLDGNTAQQQGGGLSYDGTGYGTLNFYMFDCIVTNNVVDATEVHVNANNADVGQGGGVYAIAVDYNMAFNGTVFANNAAFGTPGGLVGGGGGLFLATAQHPTMVTQAFVPAAHHQPRARHYSSKFSTRTSPVARGEREELFGGPLKVALVTNCTFRDNIGPNGGALAFLNDMTLFGAAFTTCVRDTHFINNYASARGGGIYSENRAVSGSLVLEVAHSYLRQNTASMGGGVSVGPDNGGTLEFTFCTFEANVATNSGGGLHLVHADMDSWGLTINQIYFLSNNASLYGGGVFLHGGTEGTLKGCCFLGNSAAFGGGLATISSVEDPFTTIDCTYFINNTASSQGGALFMEGPDAPASALTITTSAVLGNVAQIGGGIALAVNQKINIKLTCIFVSNTAFDSGGALAVDVYSMLAMFTVSFTNNIATYQGGGVYVSYVSLGAQLSSVTFTTNTAPLGAGLYVAEANYDNPALLDHTDFNNNNASDSGGAIFARGRISMFLGSLVSNTALNKGGGLLASDVTLVNGTSIRQNIASIGGGIYCEQCDLSIAGGANFRLNTARITGPALSCIAGSTMVIDAAVTFNANPNLASPGDLRVADCTACGCCDVAPLATINVAPCMSFPERSCAYSCPAGYDSLAGGMYQCATGPVISPATVCLKQQCRGLPFLPAYASFSVPYANTTGTTLPYACDNGYTLLGALNISCTAPNWTLSDPANPPYCQANPCPDLVNPPSGAWSRLNGSTGDVSELTCFNGLVIGGGNGTAVCTAHGWLPHSTCRKTQCPDLQAPNISHLLLAPLSGGSGDLAFYSCDVSTLGVVGPSVLLCNGTAWNISATSPACEPLPCFREQDPGNGTLSYASNGNNAPLSPLTPPSSGDVMTCTCDDGYFVSSGDAMRTCITPPNWSGTPCACASTQCDFASLPGLTPTCEGVIAFGDSCQASCQAGWAGDKGLTTGVCRQSASNVVASFVPSLPVCHICDSNSYAAEGSVVCTPCPNGGTTPSRGATRIEDCSCLAGFYEITPNGGDCAPCPLGAACAGDRTQPVAAPGYFFTGAAYAACSPSEACSGRNNCSEGYDGYLCGACAAHYYRLNGNCVACPNDVWWRIVVAVIVGLVLAYGLVVVVRPSEIGERSYGFASATIGLSFIQVVATFADLRVPWPAKTRQLFAVFSFLNLNIELASPECFATFTFWQKFQLQMSVPFIVAAFMIVLWFGWSIVAWLQAKRPPMLLLLRRASKIGKVIAGAYLFFLTVGYLLLADATLSIFACSQRPDKRYNLAESPNEFCYEADWNKNVALGILGIIFYIVAIPVLVLGVFVRLRLRFGAHVAARHMLANYLVKKYEPHRWYWEAVTMLRKLVIVVVATLFYNNAYLQVAASSAVIFLCCLATIIFKPYRWSKHNLLEIAAMIGSLIVLFCGQMSGSPLYGPIQQEVLAYVAILTVAITLLLIAGCFVLEVSIFWNIYTLKRTLHPNGDLRQIASTPSAAVAVLANNNAEGSVYVAGSDGVVRGHELAREKDLAPSLSMSVNRRIVGAALCGKGTLVVIGETIVEAWNLNSRMCLLRGGTPAELTAVATSRDTDVTNSTGVAVTGCVDGSLQFWTLKVAVETDERATLSAAELEVIFDESDAPRSSIASAAPTGLSSRNAAVPPWTEVRSVPAHARAVTALCVVDDFAYSGSLDGSVKKWSITDTCVLREWQLPSGTSVRALHETGALLLAGDTTGGIHVIDLAGVNPVRCVRAQTARITCLAGGGGNVAASCADGSVLLFASKDTCMSYRQTLVADAAAIASVTLISDDSSSLLEGALRCLWADATGTLTSHDIKTEWHMRDRDPHLATRAWTACLRRVGITRDVPAAARDQGDMVFDELSLIAREMEATSPSSVKLSSRAPVEGDGEGVGWAQLSMPTARDFSGMLARQSAKRDNKEYE